MSPSDPLQSGPPPATANHIGEKVLNALDAFVKLGDDLRRDISDIKTEVTKLGESQERLRHEITDIKIANSNIQATISNIKDLSEKNSADMKASIERNNIKLDHIEEKTSDRLHELDDRASDMKSNITALGVKTNTNLLLQTSQLIALVVGLITIIFNVNSLTKNINNISPNTQAQPSQKLQ